MSHKHFEARLKQTNLYIRDALHPYVNRMSYDAQKKIVIRSIPVALPTNVNRKVHEIRILQVSHVINDT